MPSQKLENILNLSLESTPEQRIRSEVLDVGFDEKERTWELIVKYNGSLEALREMGIDVEELLAGYAILTLPERLIPQLTQAPEIEYVEMPKVLQNGLYEAKQAGCILPLTTTGAGLQGGALSGQDVLVAILDSGIDYYLQDFRKEDGTSRIVWLWDQTLDVGRLNAQAAESGRDIRYAPPEGFSLGVAFSKEQIDVALAQGNRDRAFLYVPSVDRSGHGTTVAAIAAGSNADPTLRGVAPGSDLLVVKMANLQKGFPRTTELMRGVQWALERAREMGRPLAINISFGNSYGPHDGSSLLSRYLDNAAETGRTVICVGSGNEGASLGHAAGQLRMGESRQVELVVADYERTLNIQLWKNYADRFDITLQSPTGTKIPVVFTQTGRQAVQTGETEVLLYVGEPAPYSLHQEIFFDLLPRNTYIDPGIWVIEMTPRRIVSGNYHLYLPGQEARVAGTRFVRATPELTLTVPATAAKVLTVGASQQLYNAYADFSGRGARVFSDSESVFTDTKPDLVAPGVDLLVPAAGGGTMRVSGTSFATPLVTGAVALMMEWGIVRGNDPYLYGEKAKAFLRAGAKPLQGERVYPNEKVGYGALCVESSLPG